MKGVSFRLLVAAVVVLVGLVLAIMSFVKVQVLVGLELVVASGYVAFGILVGLEALKHSALLQMAGAIVTMLGILAVFSYSRGFDLNLHEAHSDALDGFLWMEADCSPMNTESRELQALGTEACAKQASSDQLSAVADLSKGLHYGPELTLIDAMTSVKDDPSLDYCALAFKRAQTICPSAFSKVSGEKRSVLLDAAN